MENVERREKKLKGEAFMNSLVIPFCHAKNLANHYKSHAFLCFQFFFHFTYYCLQKITSRCSNPNN